MELIVDSGQLKNKNSYYDSFKSDQGLTRCKVWVRVRRVNLDQPKKNCYYYNFKMPRKLGPMLNLNISVKELAKMLGLQEEQRP